MNAILEGNFCYGEEENEFPSMDDIEKVYSERLETVKPDLTPPEKRPEVVHDFVNYGGVTDEEVIKGIKKVRKDKAAGIDGWGAATLNKIGSKWIAVIFNY